MFFSGGMLTGSEIERQIKKGNIKITPYNPECINPNSYNLKLYPELLVYKRKYTIVNNSSHTTDMLSHLIVNGDFNNPLDMNSKNETVSLIIPKSGLVLQPNTLYIGRTIERTATDKFIPMINGRSSGGRLGISVHVCAGFGDIGFDGTWTLEITAVEPVRIYPYVEIAQICYFNPCGKIGKLYNGRYQKQINATASRFYQGRNIKNGNRDQNRE